MSYLSGLLRPEQISLNIAATDKQGVLKELVSLIPELENNSVQQEAFLNALTEREKLASTGIGNGVALPHARTALGGLLKRPLMIVGRQKNGIDFGAADAKPVQLFFLLASPNPTDHLAMLKHISRALHQGRLHQELLNAREPAEVLRLFEKEKD